MRALDEPALTAAWRAAAPFPHVVIDDLYDADELAALMDVLADEDVEPVGADIFAFEVTPVAPSPALAALRDRWTTALAAPLARIAGVEIARADLRAYAYRAGHYLLPHTDCQDGLDRRLAYAYYLPSPEPAVGGELELYRCALVDGELDEIASAAVIAPRANRLVVFEVSPRSLHQVREVQRGLRLSLAGWFYPASRGPASAA